MPNNPQDVRLQGDVSHTIDTVGPVVRSHIQEQYDPFGIWLQVDIRVKQLEPVMKFYQQILELPDNKIDWKTSDSRRSCILHLPYGKLMLEQDDEGELPKGHGIHHGISMITFITGSDESVDRVYQRLKALDNNCVIAGPYFDRYNHYKVEAVDPEGNTVAFSD